MADPRWVVFGAAGMLGTDLVELLREQQRDFIPLTHGDADITNFDAVHTLLRPTDIVVNCAAYTRVDDAETHRELAFSVNLDGASNLACACRDAGARLVHISTDYVFGEAPAGIPIAVDAPLSPRCVYGESKAEGESAVREHLGDAALIVRVAWLYGKYGHNFVRTVTSRLASGQSMRVVDDQWGQPTWTRDAARAIITLVDAGAAGTRHCTNAGATTWFEFAQAIATASGFDAEEISPIPSSEYPTPAQRPPWSVLATDPRMREWREALARFIDASN